MLNLMIASAAPVLAESTSAEPSVNPWFIGIGVMVLLTLLLLGLLMFGAGRDHS